MSKKQPYLSAGLQESFDRWDHIYREGSDDPGYPDGVSLNLVRNHILSYKRQIEERLPPEIYPEIYRRATPPEVTATYMARPDEIRAGVKKVLALYYSDENYRYLLRQSERLAPKELEKLHLESLLRHVKNLEIAIARDDLVAMRRHRNPRGYLADLSECARRVRELPRPENEQMNLFVSHDFEESGEGNEEKQGPSLVL